MNDEKKAARKTEIIRGLKFTLFSAGAGLIQLSSTLLLDEVLHVASHIAYLIGLILSVLFNFTV
ncbi:MAG: GtrA family protein, partial [Clostridia bacterium]|nr:GtrA family protein [Clostridia bacterium]